MQYIYEYSGNRQRLWYVFWFIEKCQKALFIIGSKEKVNTITQTDEIIKMGIKYMPALVVNEKLYISGQSAGVEKIISIYKENS